MIFNKREERYRNQYRYLLLGTPCFYVSEFNVLISGVIAGYSPELEKVLVKTDNGDTITFSRKEWDSIFTDPNEALIDRWRMYRVEYRYIWERYTRQRNEGNETEFCKTKDEALNILYAIKFLFSQISPAWLLDAAHEQDIEKVSGKDINDVYYEDGKVWASQWNWNEDRIIAELPETDHQNNNPSTKEENR